MRGKRERNSLRKHFKNHLTPYFLKLANQAKLQKTTRLLLLLLPYLLIKLGKLAELILGKTSQQVFHLLLVLLSFITGHRLIKTKRVRKKALLWSSFKKIRQIFNFLVPKPTQIRIALILIILIISFYSLLLIKIASSLPSPSGLTPSARPLTTQIYDRNGKLLYQFYEGRNRKLVKLSDIPPDLINATLAIEDKHFYTHPGVDLLGIVRALKANLSDGKTQGGSTLTQQLIKNTLLTPDQTWERKIKEIVLAFWTERIYSKQQILEMYFNEAPYGGPVWGAEAAAEMYFGKTAQQLSLSESAFLAGLPAAPTLYSPYGIYPEKGKERQKEVLRRMVEDGYISEEQTRVAFDQPLDFKPQIQDIKAAHFVMYVRSLLAEKYGERTVSQGGLKVYTTLDTNLQEIAEEAVATEVEKLDSLNAHNGAAMITDAKTGQILAMIGSKSYFEPHWGNYNVTLSLRQPGSSIKVITYAAAFSEGFTPGTLLLDTPTTFTNPWGYSYSPVNYDGTFHGPVSIRTALGSSYNVPAVKMLALIGLPKMLQTAKEMGLTTLTDTKNYGLSLTLGAGGVKMIEMMSVYGTLANGGVRQSSVAILKVSDSFGNVLESHEDQAKRVLTPEVAYLLSSILSDNQARTPAFGPRSLLLIPNHTVAVKTGTSDNKRDNWTFGYTPEYVVGAWVGNNDNSPMDPQLSSGITGAAPIWHTVMEKLLENKPNEEFKKPSKIIEVAVDGNKDLGIMGQNPKTVVSYQKIKQTDEKGEKEVVTLSDPFGKLIPDQPKTVQ